MNSEKKNNLIGILIEGVKKIEECRGLIKVTQIDINNISINMKRMIIDQGRYDLLSVNISAVNREYRYGRKEIKD